MPKKVVFVINNFAVGGVEKLLLDIISRLDKQKFTVSIITVLGSGPLETSFQRLGIPVYLAAGRFPILQRSWLTKISWVLISPIILVRLIWYFSVNRPAVVATSLYQADILGIWAALWARIPQRIIIQHDVFPLSRGRRWWKQQLGCNLATKVIAVSQTVKNFVQTNFGVTDHKLVVIPNGIDTATYMNVSRSVDFSHLTLGMLGRLEPVKDPQTFIEALNILSKKFGLTPVSYLGGEGSLELPIISYISQHQLTHLHLDGAIKDVPNWMNKIDILVVPSLNEGFGLVPLEGLAAGKVVIASDIPAFRELIQNGNNGYLFPAQEADTLAKILQHLLTDQNTLITLRQGIKKWQQQEMLNYDIQRTVLAYAEMLVEE